MRTFSARFVAVVVAVLLVTATFTPAVVASAVDSPTERTDPVTVRGSSLAEALAAQFAQEPPRDQKRRAVSLVENISAGRASGAERKRQRAVSLLSGTLDDYRDPTRVSGEEVFRNDSQAVQALAGLAGPNSSDVDLATRLVVQADRETARVAVADARRALNRTRDRIDVPGQVRSAEAHVDNAERALDRANETLRRSRGGLSKTVTDRARAIRHLATAWRQAQLALDGLDRATEPRVTITSRADPVRNGSNVTTRRVAVAVFDVRAYELDDVTLTVDGNETFVVPLNGTTAPAENVTGETEVPLRDRVVRVEATVEDVSAGDDDSSGSAGGPPGEDDGSADAAASPTTDVLRLDGDGLPDRFEVRVTETDPLGPDSDTPLTPDNESDDEVIDGVEDFDNDTVTTIRERVFGTDPFDADTDDDRLLDATELFYDRLDPTAADSDGNGVPDAVDDPDGDGLATIHEVRNGTNPFVADTDAEGLSDAREVRSVGTDPRQPDTDDDGLDDAAELEVGTDPLDPDSDDDGTLDGEETFTTTTGNESVGVSVAVTGQGDVASSVDVSEQRSPSVRSEAVDEARASPVVELESERPFERAEVTIGYDADRVSGAESNLAVYRFNRTLRTYVPLNTTIDATNDTVTAETSHFSTFVVFSVPNWEANFRSEIPTRGDERGGVFQPVDAMFIIDSSGSMSVNDPREFRKDAARRFVGGLIEGDRAGVVDFDSNAFVLQGLTGDFDQVNESIGRLDASGGTDIGDGIRAANRHFDAESNASRSKIAVLLSDGLTVSEGEARRQAEAAADRNITIFTVGFGNPDRDLMQDIADTTGGQFHFVEDASDLPEVFSRVAENATGGVDSDGDGLPDVVEKDGFDTGAEGHVRTDPFDADTDNDGIPDGEEVGERRNVTRRFTIGGEVVTTNRTYFALNSDPLETDTDDDGLSDFAETRERRVVKFTDDPDQSDEVIEAVREDEDTDGLFDTEQVTSDPYFHDTDSDDLDDGREATLGTDPDDADTDGDGIEDGEEFEVDEDPTLFDTSPPDIQIRAIRANNIGDVDGELLDVFDVRYTATYRVRDPSGVTETRLFKSGEIIRPSDDGVVRTGDDVPTEFFVTDDFVAESFTTYTVESVLGPQVKVFAEDAHGNADTVSRRDANAFAAFAELLADAGLEIGGLGADEVAAALSGFTFSIGEGVGGMVDLVRAILAAPEALAELPELVDRLLTVDLEVLRAASSGLLSSVTTSQRRQNPFGPREANNDTFRLAWFAGYFIGIVATAFVSAGVARGLVAVGEGAASLGSRIAARLATYGAAASSQTVTIAAKTGATIAFRLGQATSLAAERLASVFGGTTVSADTILGEAVGRLSPSTIRAIETRRAEAELVEALATGDDRAVALIDELDGEELDAFLDEDAPASFQRTLGRNFADDDVPLEDIERTLRYFDALPDTEAQLLAATVAGTDGSGVEFVASFDSPEALEDYYDLRSDEDVSVRELVDFGARTGADGADLVTDLDDDTRRRFFSLETGVLPGSERATELLLVFWTRFTEEDVDVAAVLDEVEAVEGTDRNAVVEAIAERELLLANVSAGDIPVGELAGNYDDLNDVERERVGPRPEGTVTTFEGEVENDPTEVEVDVSFPDGQEQFLRVVGDAEGDLTALNTTEKGVIAEDEVGPPLLRQRGYEVLFGDKGVNDAGIDLIARSNETGRIIIVEGKFTTSNSAVGISLLENNTRGEGVRQMSDEWIDDAFEEEIDEGEELPPAEFQAVEAAIVAETYRKELLVVQANTNAYPKTISTRTPTLGVAVGIDAVAIVKTRDLETVEQD